MGELFRVLKLSLIECEILKNEKTTTKLGQNSRKHYSLTLVGKRKQRGNGNMQTYFLLLFFLQFLMKLISSTCGPVRIEIV